METVHAATCSVAIRNTGKRVDLGLFTVISPLCIRFDDWKFLGTFHRSSLLVLSGSFMEKLTHSWQNHQNTPKSGNLFHSRFFIFHSLIQSLLPTAKMNGVSKPISIEYKSVHQSSINQSSIKLCLKPKISKT